MIFHYLNKGNLILLSIITQECSMNFWQVLLYRWPPDQRIESVSIFCGPRIFRLTFSD